MSPGNDPAIDVEALYRRYAPMVLRRCRQLLGDEESAVDALQEVFARLLAGRDRLHGRYPSSLLYRIATNICLNVIHGRRVRRGEEEGEGALARIACSDETERRTLTGAFLDRLFSREKPSTREMAVLHFVDGLTLEQVAGEFGLSVSGVRKRLREFRARAARIQEE